jgi:hypothetical protein
MNMIPKELIPPENRAIVPPAETDPLLEKRSMIRLHAGATHLAVHGLLSIDHSVVHATYVLIILIILFLCLFHGNSSKRIFGASFACYLSSMRVMIDEGIPSRVHITSRLVPSRAQH